MQCIIQNVKINMENSIWAVFLRSVELSQAMVETVALMNQSFFLMPHTT